jgi:hypothetical protein
MAYKISLVANEAVSLPYAWIGGHSALRVTVTAVASNGNKYTTTQTVTFDDPLPENPDELVVFTNDKSYDITVTVDTGGGDELDLPVLKKEEVSDNVTIVLFRSRKEGKKKKPVLMLAVSKQA